MTLNSDSSADGRPALPQQNVTRLLVQLTDGNRAVLDQLLPLIYDELRRLAGSYLRRERSGHTLQPTALVHEAYMRIVDQTQVQWQNRAHFFGVAAQMMRRILVDHARKHHASKRGSGGEKISLDEINSLSVKQDADLVALDEALVRLAEFDLQQSRIVEMKYFGGLTIEEIAAVLNLSPATIKREWATAKAWLYRELSVGDA
jgi:RNA polymerase sigma factor (TIGR02999 family)